MNDAEGDQKLIQSIGGADTYILFGGQPSAVRATFASAIAADNGPSNLEFLSFAICTSSMPLLSHCSYFSISPLSEHILTCSL